MIRIDMALILSAISLMCVSGLPACIFPAKSRAGQRLTTILLSMGSITGLAGIAIAFGLNAQAPSMPAITALTGEVLNFSWFLPWGSFTVAIDPLGAVFLGLIFFISPLGCVYGLGYWKQQEHSENGRRLGLFYGLLAGSMAMVVIERDGILILIAWEIMALAAYFAATADSADPQVRKAGWVFLVATHIGTLFLFGMFALMRYATGSFYIGDAGSLMPGMMTQEIAGVVFMLAVVGFGFKAGFMPLHVWLPGAHATAPSHVSAIMSGVMLKMGIYGILRITALFSTNEAWWGIVLLVTGAVTGLAAIIFALGQHDLKRLLAYSSIENIGIIAMGIGLALMGRSAGRPDWTMLGLAGALLHVVNHGLFKSMMFFNAGAIIHAANTREIDKLGGLSKKMPAIAFFFLLGSVAICALPPFNGFVSEWFVYMGLFKTLTDVSAKDFMFTASAAAGLAMTGALAVACFVKLFGAIFSGSPRSEATGHAHDPERNMLVPVVVLAAACATIGLVPAAIVPFLEQAVLSWSASAETAQAVGTVSPSLQESLAPIQWIGIASFAVIAFTGLGMFILFVLQKRKTAGEPGTWDCGYAAPTARMQYTGSSFTQTLVGLFRLILWPKMHAPEVKTAFPKTTRFAGNVPDTILSRVVMPFFNLAGKYVPRIR
ncbi:MAG: hydrogenase, partial [Spirochaetaceae bacterium]